MGKRQQITTGSILEINIRNQYFTYAQILTEADYAFFDYKSEKRLTDFSVLNEVDILFIVAVYDKVITQGHWLKVAKLDLRENFKVKPMKFIQDAIYPEKFELYDPNTGEIRPAPKTECKGLERASVWDAEHVEERIFDHYEGRMNHLRKIDLDIFND